MLQMPVHILSGKVVTRTVRRHLHVDPVLHALLNLAFSTFDIALPSILSEETNPATTAPGKGGGRFASIFRDNLPV